jgi:hypothetical protein
MVDDVEIWRAAAELLDSHGPRAEAVAGQGYAAALMRGCNEQCAAELCVLRACGELPLQGASACTERALFTQRAKDIYLAIHPDISRFIPRRGTAGTGNQIAKLAN